MRQRIITKLIIKAYQNTEFKYKITSTEQVTKKRAFVTYTFHAYLQTLFKRLFLEFCSALSSHYNMRLEQWLQNPKNCIFRRYA